jgi:precorrin-6A synthase
MAASAGMIRWHDLLGTPVTIRTKEGLASMRKVLIIGVGAGDPEYVTVQAIRALNEASVFFVIDKGREKGDLARLRQEICDRYIETTAYRMVEIPDPERNRTAVDYREAVNDWRKKRADLVEAVIRDELNDDETGAFLVWGDPSIYDGTLAIVERIAARGALELTYRVIPGISSIQALAARHGVGLNGVGEPILITTGRRVSQGLPEGINNVVVMLDGDGAFTKVADEGLDLYWGAYLGTPDEILLSGDLTEIKDTVARVRSEARERKGWIMDTYLLRRTDD